MQNSRCIGVLAKAREVSVAVANSKKRSAVPTCVACLKRRSVRVLDICNLLEALADDLPRKQASLLREVRRQSKDVLLPYYQLLSQHVLPVLLRRTEGEDERQDLLLKLHADCVNRIETVRQLYDLFTDVTTTTRFDDQPEALGYALRGFFEVFRNDASWQIDVLWPLSMQVLTDEDAQQIRSIEGVIASPA